MSKARELADLIADGAVGTGELSDGAITPIKLSKAYLPLDEGGTVDAAITVDGLTVIGAAEIDGSANGNIANLAFTRTDASWSLNNETNLRIYGNTGDTASPSVKRLEIGVGGDISFYEDTGTTAKFFWGASTERLGIGTTSPASKLDVYSTSSNGFHAGSAGSQPAIIASGSYGGGIGLKDGVDTAGMYTINNGATLNVFVGQSSSDSASSKVVMTMEEGGNVGIGTTSPGYPLDVNGIITSDGLLINGNTGFGQIEVGGDSGGYIDIKKPNSNDYDARLIYAGSTFDIHTNADEAIRLRHGNVTKLATRSTGVIITGTLTAGPITNGSATGSLNIGGGAAYNTGGNIILYGESHAQTGDILFRNGTKYVGRFTSGGDFRLFDDTGASTLVHWDASTERFGIGKADPTHPLDIKTTIPDSSTAGTTILNLIGATGGDIHQQKLFIDFELEDSNGNETPQVRIGAEVGPNSNANSVEKEGSGAFIVYTNNAETGDGESGTSLAERFRVDYIGQVGIGTNTPSAHLHVQKGAAGSITYPSGNWAAKIFNQNDASTEGGLVVANRWAGDTSTPFLVGGLYDAGDGFDEFLKVDGTGNVDVPRGSITNHLGEVVDKRFFSSMPRLISGLGVGDQDSQEQPFISGWSMAYVTSNVQVQSVVSGTYWDSRTATEQELLTLMGRSGVRHFIGNFYIHEVTAVKSAGGHAFPYQKIMSAGPTGATTHGAFVKHISGPVPYGWWCNGLVANGGWQFCRTITKGNANMSYNHTHPYLPSNDGTPSVIQVALPGSVDRYINEPTEWSVHLT